MSIVRLASVDLVIATITPADGAVFVIAGLAILVGALGVVFSRNPVHAALMLVLTLFGVAVLFVAQQADFLAAVQVIVYAGAIVILFLFVIMLIGVDREESITFDPLKNQRLLAGVVGVVTLVELLLIGRVQWTTGAPSVSGTLSGADANVEKLGRSIFSDYLLAFELTSVLLVIAIVGAVVLSRQTRQSSISEHSASEDDGFGSEAIAGASAESSGVSQSVGSDVEGTS